MPVLDSLGKTYGSLSRARGIGIWALSPEPAAIWSHVASAASIVIDETASI